MHSDTRQSEARDETIRRRPELSMDMTGDFEDGATVVRVGQAIFGERPPADNYYRPGASDQS